MIIKGPALEHLLKRPAAAVRAMLFYGPNEGRVREYAARAVLAIVDDLSDPFRISNLSAADLKDDPARLPDEAAAIAMTGGRRVVRLRGAADGQIEGFATFLDQPIGDTLIIAEAGELARTSKLRKLFESHPACAIAACYEDSTADLAALVTGHLRQHGLTINSDARDYLLQCLGADRMATRQELEKLVLYMGPPGIPGLSDDGTGVCDVTGPKGVPGVIDTIDVSGGFATADINDGYGFRLGADIPDTNAAYDVFDAPDIDDVQEGDGIRAVAGISGASVCFDTSEGMAIRDTNDTQDTAYRQDSAVSLADVMACIGDSASQGLDGICEAVSLGDLAGLDSQMVRAVEAALSSVAILRSASNHLLRLQLIISSIGKGLTIDSAMRGLRPPVHFSRVQSFQRQARLWNAPRLARALDLLLQAEAACKSTGAPEFSLCSLAMIQVARIARSGRS
ncbi:MAG: DNA polymerase III subunit delta [Alphaproteobacteria bacterium]